MPRLMLIRTFAEPTQIARFKTANSAQNRLQCHIEKFRLKWFSEENDNWTFYKDEDIKLNTISETTAIASNLPIELGGEKRMILIGLEYEP